MKKLLFLLLQFPLFGSSLLIDCGSPQDQFFVGGAPFTITVPGATGDLTLRYGVFSYRIPQPPGVYLVTLNLRETGTVNGPGQRSFSVKLNGQLVIDRIDLFAVAGLNPKERGYVVPSNDGFIDIDFSYSLKSAIVSSIVVQQLFQE